MKGLGKNKVIGMFGISTDDLSVWQMLFNPEVEVNVFSLPKEDCKDSVIKMNNIYIHQYARTSREENNRKEEIIRDILALHADHYFVSKNSFSKDVLEALEHYGYSVVVI